MDLNAFFHAHPKAALAFSGGVDSAYLLYAAIQCGAAVRAYFVKSAFQPLFELEDARRLAESLHADWKVLEADVLAIPQVTQNPPDRCYFCKRHCSPPSDTQRWKTGIPCFWTERTLPMTLKTVRGCGPWRSSRCSLP